MFCILVCYVAVNREELLSFCSSYIRVLQGLYRKCKHFILPHGFYHLVYSMRSNRQEPRERTGHGQAITEQTWPRSAMEPLVLSAPKAPFHPTLRDARVGLSALKPKANAPKYALSLFCIYHLVTLDHASHSGPMPMPIDHAPCLVGI